jgi:acyl CoA:acetate/3-ketoacid CoA transferase
LEPRGLVLEEIAPGIDVRKDILDQAEFEIFVDPNLREMDKRIFLDQPLNLREELLRQ